MWNVVLTLFYPICIGLCRIWVWDSIIKESMSMRFNNYLPVDIDCYIYPSTNGDKICNWGRWERGD